MKNSDNGPVHTLKDTWDLGARRITTKDFQTVLRAVGETETTQENIQDILNE
jgi:hypothetical protein